MPANPHHNMVPLFISIGVFLILYSLGIAYMFTRTVYGRRRRWEWLDLVWVPMGGLTGILMLALWWRNHS